MCSLTQCWCALWSAKKINSVLSLVLSLIDYINTGLLNSTVIFYSSGVHEIVVDILDDEILETTEQVVVTLSNPQPDIVEFNQSSITISIVDNDIRKLSQVKIDVSLLLYQ